MPCLVPWSLPPPSAPPPGEHSPSVSAQPLLRFNRGQVPPFPPGTQHRPWQLLTFYLSGLGAPGQGWVQLRLAPMPRTRMRLCLSSAQWGPRSRPAPCAVPALSGSFAFRGSHPTSRLRQRPLSLLAWLLWLLASWKPLGQCAGHPLSAGSWAASGQHGTQAGMGVWG